MRILHVIPSIAAGYGGPSRAVIAMARHQRAAGIRTSIATTHHKNDVREALGDDIEIHSFSSTLGEYKFSFGLCQWLVANVKKYDLLHIHSIFCFSTFFAAIQARRARIPYILRPVGQLYPWAMRNKSYRLKKIYWRLLEQKTFSHASAIHFTTKNERDESVIKEERTRAYILPHGTEAPVAIPRVQAEEMFQKLKNKKVLLFLSRIHPVKGLDLAIPWLAPLIQKRADWVFVIAGEADRPEYFEGLKRQIRQCGIEERVVLVGHVSGNRKSALHVLADLFLLPSHSENFGIAVIEAMAAGIPVLVSDQVGLHDEVTRHEAGLVFRLEQDSFSAATVRLMDDPLLRMTKGEKAQRLVKTEFDWQAITSRQIEYYEQITRNSGFNECKSNV